jgi:ATP-dependent DNA helicase RecQ
VAAQKALSCVYRTGERFGAGYLTNVLMGKQTQQIQRWGHDRIKTFGVGQELDRNTWMSVFRQLLSAGLLSVDMGKISGFRLRGESRAVLRGSGMFFSERIRPLQKNAFKKAPPKPLRGPFWRKNLRRFLKNFENSGWIFQNT